MPVEKRVGGSGVWGGKEGVRNGGKGVTWSRDV